MPKKYVCGYRDTCTDCHGVGAVIHPLWEQFQQFSNSPTTRGLATDAQEQALLTWWRERGFANTAAGWDALPAEDQACLTCGGTGQQTREIALEDALADLGLLRRR